MNDPSSDEKISDQLPGLLDQYSNAATWSEKAQRKKIKDALLDWYDSREDKGKILDFSQCDPAFLLQLPPEISDIISRFAEKLRLPANLDYYDVQRLRPFLENLPHVEALYVPEYDDERLDLRSFFPQKDPYNILVDGKRVNSVFASGRVNVYAQDAEEEDNIRVHRYDKHGTIIDSEWALGYFRTVGPGGKTDGLQDVLHADDDLVVCRHKALLSVIIDHEYQDALEASKSITPQSSFNFQKRADRRFAEIGTEDKLLQRYSRQLDKIDIDLRCNSPESAVVSHSGWGKFLIDQFEEITNGSFEGDIDKQQHLYVTTSQHAMILRMRAKKRLMDY